MTPPKSRNVEGLLGKILKPRPCAASVPPIVLISGLMRPLVNAVTIAVDAEPMTTATARATTLPRIRKSLKPLNNLLSSRTGTGDGLAESNRYRTLQRNRRHPRRDRLR